MKNLKEKTKKVLNSMMKETGRALFGRPQKRMEEGDGVAIAISGSITLGVVGACSMMGISPLKSLFSILLVTGWVLIPALSRLYGSVKGTAYDTWDFLREIPSLMKKATRDIISDIKNAITAFFKHMATISIILVALGGTLFYMI